MVLKESSHHEELSTCNSAVLEQSKSLVSPLKNIAMAKNTKVMHILKTEYFLLPLYFAK